ncbi:MAG: penicillin acylase family protein [Burkholderiales bacterium]|nr:penicillin acylase family protein [Burkholderiales bacterium]
MRAWKWLIGGLAALLLLAAIVALAYGSMALPRTRGTVVLQGDGSAGSAYGLAGAVRIERDAWGIPTIRAANERDAWFGLGYVHAQDRLWQLETHRRIGAGRLAEAFGAGALDTDRFLRALAVRRTAQAQWDHLGEASREPLRAYAAGINAVLREQLPVRPPEFVILGIEPERWTPVDSLAWALMMAWDLGGNWRTELLRLRLALKMPVAQVDQLLPPAPGDAPRATADYARLFRGLHLAQAGEDWQRLAAIAPPSGVEGVGSNNWVVAGRRSRTGHPLLANDPHLKLSTPALWYFARIEVPGLSLAGATLPGLPGVVLGQNEHVAWGFTNTGPDVQDLYIEQIDPADPQRYRTPQGWAPFETATELIKVRGGADVTMTVRRTRHGPVISDAGAAGGADLVGGGGRQPAYALALRWTALDPTSDPIAPQAAMQRAASVAQFFEATQGWMVPMQNMVVADDAGHIGMISPGRVPLRRADNDLQGQVPSPGWDARYDWDGWIPVEQTPREIDPERGWIASANNRITPSAYPWYLTNEWALPYRAERIAQLLEARPRHSLDDLAAIQGDQLSLAAVKLLPWLRRAHSTHHLAGAAQALLASFDGRMSADSAAPLIYWAWQRELAQGLFADDTGGALWERSLAGRSFQDALEGVLQRDDRDWCDDRRTAAIETCEQQNDAAFTRALTFIERGWGPDLSKWRWGRAHTMRAEHRPFSHVPWLARWFELRAPVGGDTYSINVSRVALAPDPETGELFLDEHGPSLRALYDLGDRSNSRIVDSSGQSGIPWSIHYHDLLPRWLQVGYVPLWAQGPPTRVLVLEPRR